MIKLKDHFCASIEDFIGIIEGSNEVDLDRGEHETCILAANLLRRALRAGLPKEIKVSVEFKTKNRKKIDLLLLGSSKKRVHHAFVLEFKQWSKIESKGNNLFSARMWGEHDSEFQLNKKGSTSANIKTESCPLFQTHGYHKEIEHAISSRTAVKSALVMPNLQREDAADFIRESQKNPKIPTEVFSHNDLGRLIGELKAHLKIPPTTVPPNLEKKLVTSNSFSAFVPDPPLSSNLFRVKKLKRHGWVGSLHQFIRDCEENTIVSGLTHNPSVSEKRAILFSSNHLAFALRRLAHSAPDLGEKLGVIIEYKLSVQGGRIDAVLASSANAGGKKTLGRLLAIEMKAWSSHFMKEFKSFEMEIGANEYPSEFEYTAKKGEPIRSQHPVQQISEYIEDLQSEFDGDVHGLAWLHNVQSKLTSPLDKLVMVKHTQFKVGEASHSVFNIVGKEPVPLLTHSYRYIEPKRDSAELLSLEEYICSHFKRGGIPNRKMNESLLATLCKPPKLSNFAITTAFRNAEYIVEEVLDKKQKKLVQEIVGAVKKAQHKRSQGDTPQHVIFAVEGDAGTGKTFVALASIGIVLNTMEGTAIQEALTPHLISCSSAASDLLTRRCRAKELGLQTASHFVVSLQNFNSVSRYYLSNLHYLRWKDPANPPPLLLFDEAQLMAPTPDAQMRGMASPKIGILPSEIDDFKKYAEEEGLRALDADGKVLKVWKTNSDILTNLADVTVCFMDPKQTTKAIAHGNITKKNLLALSPGKDVRIRSLKKSYRSEESYLALLRHVLYDELPRKRCCRPPRKFKFNVADNLKNFLENFDSMKDDKTKSLGIVAGYTREHKSAEGGPEIDWDLDGREFQWNTKPARQWIIDKVERENRIGYFLAVQGNELDHLFVIIGEDLTAKPTSKGGYEICVDSAAHDNTSACKKGIEDNSVHKECILNQYWVLLTRAKVSCTVYCFDPTLRKYFQQEASNFGY